MQFDWKNPYTKVFVVIVAFMVVAAGWAIFLRGEKTDKAPDFTVTDLNGERFTLSDYRGKKVVLIDFMSTTCASCKEEMKYLKEIYEMYGNRIELISIDVQKSDTEEDLRDFMKEHNANWRAALDTDNCIGKYSITEIVRTVIVDKEGRITYSHVGISDTDTLSEHLDKAIEGTATSIEISTGAGLIGLAIGAGIFSFFSPCSFPLLPGYMSYYLGRSTSQMDTSKEEAVVGVGTVWDEEEKKKREAAKSMKTGALSGIATALGIIFLYSLIGILIALAGGLVSDYIEFFEPIIGVLLIFLGIMMVHDVPIGQHLKNAWMYMKFYLRGKASRNIVAQTTVGESGTSEKTGIIAGLTQRVEKVISRLTGREFSFENAKKEGFLGLFLFGIGYGAASASCTAPLFIAVILAALSAGGAANGFLIFMVYAISMGFLMVVVTLLVAVSRDILLNKIRSITRPIEVIGGFSLEIVGLYMVWYYLNI